MGMEPGRERDAGKVQAAEGRCRQGRCRQLSEPLASGLGYSVKCEYTAHKEGVLKEEMVLASEAGEGATIRVVVQARVMGKGLLGPGVGWQFLPGAAGNRHC